MRALASQSRCLYYGDVQGSRAGNCLLQLANCSSHSGTKTAAQLSLGPGTKGGPHMKGGPHASGGTCRLHSLSGCEGAERASSQQQPRVAGRLQPDDSRRPPVAQTPPGHGWAMGAPHQRLTQAAMHGEQGRRLRRAAGHAHGIKQRRKCYAGRPLRSCRRGAAQIPLCRHLARGAHPLFYVHTGGLLVPGFLTF